MRRGFVFLILVANCGIGLRATALQGPEADRELARQILSQLIEIRTSPGRRATPEAAAAMARRLREAGFPERDLQLLTPEPGLGLLVARYRSSGSGGRPILLMAHLDVVEALREDWSFDPFVFREEGGYFYGRGTSDNKAGAAILVANLIRLKREGFLPRRDLILLLTGDEESNALSIRWLLESHRDLIDSAFALNTDAGGGELKEGRPHLFSVQASEKVYLTFQLEVRDRGGHSSLPRPRNAIYLLSAALSRLAADRFPLHLNAVTRATLRTSARFESGPLAEEMRAAAGDPPDSLAAERLSGSSPLFNAMLRTTCVATRLEGGHADNALPQTARATVNCRILPGEDPAWIEQRLQAVLADKEVHLRRIGEPKPSPPSPLTPAIMGPIEKLVARMWPEAAVIPEMSTGATDGLFVRNAGIPVYGVSAIFAGPDDRRAHGRDERVGVREFYQALEFWYRMLQAFAR